MRLYLDTADRDAAEDLMSTGIFTGVTTNPTILQRAGLGVAAAPDIYKWATAAGLQGSLLPVLGPDHGGVGRARAAVA